MTHISASDSRLTIYPIAIIFALALGVVAGGWLLESNGQIYGGDYPAFYGAGSIAMDGDWDQLYELDRQVEAQGGLRPPEDGPSARYFAYPPQVALAYLPFAAIGYYWSYIAHTLLMGLLLWGAVLLARPMVPWLRGRVALATAAAMLFWPMFRTVTGGSNTALTLFLIVAGWRLVQEDRQIAAGVVLSGLLYKPQIAIPLVGLFLLARYWRVLVGAVAGASVFYLLGAALRGWGWVTEWLDVASEFGRIDAELNGHSAISFVGFAENLFGAGMSPPVAFAWLFAIATALLLSWFWWRSFEGNLERLLAITMPGLLLLSLHAMSHDGAIVVLTAAVGVALWSRQRWMPWVVAIWVLGASQMFIKQLGWSPGFPMLLLVMWWGWLLLGSVDQGDPVSSMSEAT